MKAADLIQLAHKNKDIDVDEKDFFSLFYFDTISPRPQKVRTETVSVSFYC